MRVALVALLGIALLAVLWFRSGVREAPIATAPPETVESAANVTMGEPSEGLAPERAALAAPTVGRLASASRAVIRGRVVWADGTPAGEVQVRRAYDGNAAHFRDVTTAADGTFALQLEHGEVVAVEAALGACVAPQVRVAADAPPPELLLCLPCAPSLRGQLVDPDGHGVRGIVWVWEEQDEGRWERGEIETTGEGVFAADLPSNRRHLLVGSAVGFASSGIETVEARADGPAPPVMLRLAALLELRGIVVDDTGAPIPEAELVLRPEVPEEGWTSEWFPEMYGEQQETTAAADGTFAFRGLSPHATFALTYRPDAESVVSVRREHIAATDGFVRLVVQRDQLLTGTVRGTVCDAAGAPLRNYEIMFQGAGGWREVANDAGSFMCEGLPWGREYAVLVRARDVDEQLVGACRIDRELQDLALRVQAPGSLTVAACDAAGAPVDAMCVVVLRYRIGASTFDAGAAPTAADGRARFPSLCPGTYDVTVHTSAQDVAATASVRAGVEEIVSVQLQAAGALTVVVRDARGRPVPGARVKVAPAEAKRFSFRGTVSVSLGRAHRSARSADTTDAQGSVRFASLEPSRYHVTVSLAQRKVEAFAVVRSGADASVEVPW